MNYVRSITGTVSKGWNSINPATLSGAIDVIVVEQEDGMSVHCLCKDKPNIGLQAPSHAHRSTSASASSSYCGRQIRKSSSESTMSSETMR